MNLEIPWPILVPVIRQTDIANRVRRIVDSTRNLGRANFYPPTIILMPCGPRYRRLLRLIKRKSFRGCFVLATSCFRFCKYSLGTDGRGLKPQPAPITLRTRP